MLIIDGNSVTKSCQIKDLKLKKKKKIQVNLLNLGHEGNKKRK